MDQFRVAVNLAGLRVDFLTPSGNFYQFIRQYFSSYLSEGIPEIEISLDQSQLSMGDLKKRKLEDRGEGVHRYGDRFMARVFTRCKPIRISCWWVGNPKEAFFELLRSYIPEYLLMHNALVISGSSVIKNGSAFCFLGSSGSGKSTVVALIADRDSSVSVLTDKVFVMKWIQPGLIEVSAAPIGLEYIDMAPPNRAAKLQKVFSLERSEGRQWAAMDNEASVQCLLDNSSGYFKDVSSDKVRIEVFELACKISKSIKQISPIEFRKSPDFWNQIAMGV